MMHFLNRTILECLLSALPFDRDLNVVPSLSFNEMLSIFRDNRTNGANASNKSYLEEMWNEILRWLAACSCVTVPART